MCVCARARVCVCVRFVVPGQTVPARKKLSIKLAFTFRAAADARDQGRKGFEKFGLVPSSFVPNH